MRLLRKYSYEQITFVFIVISALLRLLIAGNLEFGNDEVYYWLYAKYPDFSHFDHPPMVGFCIQFFTLNLWIDSEIMIRLASIIPASMSMIVIFRIAKEISDEKAGLISVILYNLSFYGFVISGIFILPDSPFVLFWLLSFYYFLKTIFKAPKEAKSIHLFLAFIFSGLSIYSKYQALYLLLGASSYVLFYNREWLKRYIFYLGLSIPFVFIGVIFYWNYQNDFISFNFHSDRVSLLPKEFKKNTFFRELLGQVVYNNPYVFILILFSIKAFLRGKQKVKRKLLLFFSFFTIPLIATTIYLSISRNTLPHWSGISYLTLIPIAAVFCSTRAKIIRKLSFGFIAIYTLLIFSVLVINRGWFLIESNQTSRINQGRNDVLMDIYGWKQAAEKVQPILASSKFSEYDVISNRWYPAAHIDYYITSPINKDLYCIGNLKDIHKYHWINSSKKPIKENVLFLTDSRNYKNPKIFEKQYPKSELIKAIPITRAGIVVKNFFIYELTR